MGNLHFAAMHTVVGWLLDLLRAAGSLAGIAALLAAGAIGHAEWARRRNSAEASAQGVQFNVNRRGILTRNGKLTPTQQYTVSVLAVGPGTKYDVYTRVWGMPENWLESSDCAARFTNESAALTQHLDIREGSAHEVWAGISYQTPYANGIRTKYVRVNLETLELQIWEWGRFGALRKWWQRQRTIRIFGGGKRAPIGRWKQASSGIIEKWHQP